MWYSNISRNTLTEHKYLAVRIAREKISGSGRRHGDADTAGKIFVAKGRESSLRSAEASPPARAVIPSRGDRFMSKR
ncbi:hypothetical protein [Cohnella sp.]|uniref:hypothetical protein n=1 Tax=Cohnella sp. TaxID=1883426 RepID=UPI003704352B